MPLRPDQRRSQATGIAKTMVPSFRLSLAAALPVVVLCVGLPGVAMAQARSPWVELAAIDREVAGFTGHSIGQAGGAQAPVDRRLRLAACQAPLVVGWRSPRREAVEVACPDIGSWHIYVPLRALEPAALAIARGEAVAIVVVGDGFAVSQPGEAMDSGALGDWIRVRSIKDGTPKGEPIRGRITRPGEVEVPVRD